MEPPIYTKPLIPMLLLANIPWIIYYFLQFLQANWVNFSNANNYVDAHDGVNASDAAKAQALK